MSIEIDTTHLKNLWISHSFHTFSSSSTIPTLCMLTVVNISSSQISKFWIFLTSHVNANFTADIKFTFLFYLGQYTTNYPRINTTRHRLLNTTSYLRQNTTMHTFLNATRNPWLNTTILPYFTTTRDLIGNKDSSVLFGHFLKANCCWNFWRDIKRNKQRNRC